MREKTTYPVPVYDNRFMHIAHPYNKLPIDFRQVTWQVRSSLFETNHFIKWTVSKDGYGRPLKLLSEYYYYKKV
jgi:hypothetical protein